MICYYHADEAIEGDDLLVHLPIHRFDAYFSSSRNRLPQQILLPDSIKNPHRKHLFDFIQKQIKSSVAQRAERFEQLTNELRSLEPKGSGNVRVLINSTSHSTVIQFVAQGLAKGLQAMGWTVKISVNHHELENPELLWQLEDHRDFQPDLVINFNRSFAEHLHPNVTQLIWFQDECEDFHEARSKGLREKDVILCHSNHLYQLFAKGGHPHIHRQDVCYDDSIFSFEQNEERNQRIVFVGSSYHSHLKECTTEEQNFTDELSHLLKNPGPDLYNQIEEISSKYGLDGPRRFYILNHLIRERSILAACRQKVLPIEVYGYGWDDVPEVAPYFKGAIEHGEELANLYRSSSHSLCPFTNVYSQRFFESVACGCVPLQFDMRSVHGNHDFDDTALYFSDQDSLEQALKEKISVKPGRVRTYGYSGLSGRIEELTKSLIRTP